MTQEQLSDQFARACEISRARGQRVFKFDGVLFVLSAITGNYHALGASNA